MEMFWRLVMGHLIGDFTLQTNYIAAWKRKNLTGMLVHCAIHPLIYSLFLWNYMGQVWVQVGPLALTGWACAAIIFATHFAEDQWRVWSVSKKDTRDNTFFYIWDQVIHYVVLFSMSPSIDGSVGKFGVVSYPVISGAAPLIGAQGMGLWERFLTVTRPEPWVLGVILFVLVTHFTTVSIYFLEKDLFGKDFPGDKEKYIGMAERLAVSAAFLLPGHWWTILVAAWLLYILVGKVRKTNPATWTNLILSNLAAVLCGLLSRGIFYS